MEETQVETQKQIKLEVQRRNPIYLLLEVHNIDGDCTNFSFRLHNWPFQLLNYWTTRHPANVCFRFCPWSNPYSWWFPYFCDIPSRVDPSSSASWWSLVFPNHPSPTGSSSKVTIHDKVRRSPSHLVSPFILWRPITHGQPIYRATQTFADSKYDCTGEIWIQVVLDIRHPIYLSDPSDQWRVDVEGTISDATNDPIQPKDEDHSGPLLYLNTRVNTDFGLW